MDECLEKAQTATSGTAVFGTSELPSVFSLEVVQVLMSEVEQLTEQASHI